MKKRNEKGMSKETISHDQILHEVSDNHSKDDFDQKYPRQLDSIEPLETYSEKAVVVENKENRLKRKARVLK